MKVSEQASMILLCLVSGIYTTWQERVCEGKYKGISCLGSYPCMEAFLRCDCIPLQFAGQKFEDLCWTSLAYEVGAPTCCLNVRKRQYPRSKRVDRKSSVNNAEDLLASINRHKFNHSKKLVNEIFDNDKRSKKKTINLNGAIHQYTFPASSFGEKDPRSSFAKPFHNLKGGIFYSKLRNIPRQKFIKDIIAAYLKSQTMPDEFKTGNKFKDSSHISDFKDLQIENTFLNSNGVESADENLSSMFTTESPIYINAEPIAFINDNKEGSDVTTLEEESDYTIQSALKMPCDKNNGDNNLNSLSKPRTEQGRRHLNLMKSRILEALNDI